MRYNNVIFKPQLPMSHDSSKTNSDSIVKMKIMKTPRSSTLNFVRQFARTCVVLEGTSFNRFSVN